MQIPAQAAIQRAQAVAQNYLSPGCLMTRTRYLQQVPI